MSRIIGILGLGALLLLWILGVNFREIRLGPAFISLGGFFMALAITRFFSQSQWRIPRSLVLLAPAAAYFWWRTLAPVSVSLAESDRDLILIAVAGVMAVGAIRAYGGAKADVYLLVSMGILALANFGVACYQAWGDPAFMVIKANVRVDTQVSGLLTHHNPFASFIGGILAYAFTGLLLFRKKKMRILCGVITGTCLLSVALSQSRGGFLAAGAVLMTSVVACFLLKHFRKDKNTVTIVLSGISIVVAAIVVVGFYNSYIENERGKDILAGGVRPALFGLATNLFFENPAAGNGPRSYSYLSAQRWSDLENGWAAAMPEFAHNEYLQTLVDYGLIGFALIFVILVSGFILGGAKLLSGDERTSSGDVLLVGAFAGLAGFLVQCFFSFLAHVPTTLMMCVMHVGILFEWQKENFLSGGRRFLSRAMGLLFLGFALWFGYRGWGYTQALVVYEKEADWVGSARNVNAIYDVGKASKQGKYYVEGAAKAFSLIGRADSPEEKAALLQLAKEGYQRAHDLNPKTPEAASGYALTLDVAGQNEEAEKWHQLAVKNSGGLSRRLGFLQAYGRNQFQLALKVMPSDRVAGERALRHAEHYLKWGGHVGEAEETYASRLKQRSFALKWISYLEGRRLYFEGNRLWKKRKASQGLALMLAADKRYRISQKEISNFDPSWTAEWELLQSNLRLLKAANITPAKLSKEEIEAIALGPFKDGLASGGVKR